MGGRNRGSLRSIAGLLAWGIQHRDKQERPCKVEGGIGLLGSSSDVHMFLTVYSCMCAHGEKQQRRKQRDRDNAMQRQRLEGRRQSSPGVRNEGHLEAKRGNEVFHRGLGGRAALSIL